MTLLGSSTSRRTCLCSVSIDLDEIHHYRAIYGLPPKEAARLVYERAVPRALELAARRSLPLTFFAVSDDLRGPRCASILRRAIEAGHTVESHSASHPYDLVRLPRDAIRREVAGSFDAIEAALGVRPEGFRAPGYTLSSDVLDAVEEAGAKFDASVLPSPPYALAKLAAMGAIVMTGRRSASIAGPAAAAFGPTEPYRPGSPPWARGARPLVEIPMTVTRLVRLPVIGTSLGAAGVAGARLLVRACLPARSFSLELHGIDFLDMSDGLEDLGGHAVELGRPLERRIAALEAALDELGTRGFTFVSLRELAARSVTSPCT